MRSKIFAVIILWAGLGFAQNAQPKPAAKTKANPNQAQQAFIKAEQAYIFTKPDFDSEITTILTPGKQAYFISRGKWGPFYKIRLAPGQTGYVLDTDVLIVNGNKQKNKTTGNSAATSAENTKKPDAKNKKKKSFIATRYWGPVVQLTNFQENTMGGIYSTSLPFYGLRWSGYNTIFPGMGYTDADLMIHWGAPGYYGVATGNSADGWMIFGDLLWEYTQLQSRTVLTYLGIGPMFRYSHINSTLNVGGIRTDYSLDDMVLGAVVNGGVGARFGSYALRFDGKYYWEKQKYWALGLAFQFEF